MSYLVKNMNQDKFFKFEAPKDTFGHIRVVRTRL